MQTETSTVTDRETVTTACARLGINRDELYDSISAIQLSWDTEDRMVASALETVESDFIPYRNTIQYPDDWAAETADSLTDVYTASLWRWLGENHQAIEYAVCTGYLSQADDLLSGDQLPSLTQYAVWRTIIDAIIDQLPPIEAE